MSESWVLGDFETGLKQLEAALSGPIKSDLERAGCIQYFEFTFELAWKSIRTTASELGQPDCLSPKTCLKVFESLSSFLPEFNRLLNALRKSGE